MAYRVPACPATASQTSQMAIDMAIHASAAAEASCEKGVNIASDLGLWAVGRLTSLHHIAF